MAQNVAKEEEWGKCLVAEARAIDFMISINLKRDWIKDLEYNIADHLEKQDIDVVDIKQEIFEDVSNGDRVAAIEETKEEDLGQAVSETTYVNGDLYKESMEENILKAEVYDQSSVISRSK